MRVWRLVARALLLPVLLGVLAGVAATPVVEASPSRPMVGFSFSAAAARYWQQDPDTALTTLLDRFEPDMLRLPVYWSDAQPAADRFDFDVVDHQMDLVREHNSDNPQHPTLVTLVVGARNLGYPEVFLPAWLRQPDDANFQEVLRGPEYQQYLAQSFAHFASAPLLYAWQVENEPLDNIQNRGTGAINLTASQVSSTVKLLRQYDRSRPAVVTTFNSASLDLDKEGSSVLAPVLKRLGGPQPVGSPKQALGLGDVLGLDVYVVTPPFNQMSDAEVDQRLAMKAPTLDYWSGRARQSGKQLWLTEVQAAPWETVLGFTTRDLLNSASVYRGRGYSVILLWDVEHWLGSDSWMDAGAEAMSILRS